MQYLKNINTPKLSDPDIVKCEGKLTLKEDGTLFYQWQTIKARETTVLRKNFMFVFGGSLGSFLVRTLNFCHEVGELTSSQRQAVISLIEKKDKDKRYIKYWRPISLLNLDLKIASKALAARIKKVIGSVILYDQTAYVKGRYIRESIRLIQDIIEYADEMDEEGILFSSDI